MPRKRKLSKTLNEKKVLNVNNLRELFEKCGQQRNDLLS